MLVGFVNAGLMTLHQAVGTIFGANIGTTVTAQLVSFKISGLIYPAVGIGALLNFFGQRRTYKYVGQAVLGFGVLFLGITVMSEAMAPLQEMALFKELMVNFGRTPLFGVLLGLFFTAVIQSSSATTGLVIAMSMQEIISLESAMAIMAPTSVPALPPCWPVSGLPCPPAGRL